MHIKGLAAALLALSAIAAGASDSQHNKQQTLAEKLRVRLETIARSLDGVMGYSVVDLTSGERFDRLENEIFPTASTIKLSILYELFRQADDHRLKLDEPKPLDRRLVVGGSGVLNELSAPVLSLRDHAILMIVLSDNTATNVVIDTLGMQAITSRMAGFGLAQTKVRRRMIDMEAARRGDENVSTPAELIRLLQILAKGEGLQEGSRRAALEILQKSKSSPMLRGIPSGVKVASKPGSLDGVRVDAGIVYVPGRPYAFAAMTTYLKEDVAGERAIEETSRACYEYFSRLGAASEYGRPIKN